MKALPALLALAGQLWFASAACAAPPAQVLSINFHGDGARATQLPQYDPSAPIDVRVKEGSGERVDAVSMAAAGPNGELIQTPLVRGADGAFSGTLSLQEQGPWRLRLTARAGTVSTETSAVLLDVQAAPPSNAWQIGLAVGLAIFLIFGGGGFLVLRRTVGTADRRQTRTV